MAGEINVNGSRYPVTDKFQQEVLDSHPDLADLPYDQLTQMRGALLKLSDMRNSYMVPAPKEKMGPSGTLTATEHDRLQAITQVINVHHGVRFLQDRSHEDFGFTGVDQIHGNRHTLACGCVLHTVFDHHKRHEEDKEIHPHHPRSSCDAHAHLLDDFKAHHLAAMTDARKG